MGDPRRTHWHVRFSFCFLFISFSCISVARTYARSRYVCMSGPESSKTAFLFLQIFFSIYVFLYRKFKFKFIQRLHSSFIYIYISFFSFWFLQWILNEYTKPMCESFLRILRNDFFYKIIVIISTSLSVSKTTFDC